MQIRERVTKRRFGLRTLDFRLNFMLAADPGKAGNEKLVFTVPESSKSRFLGKLRYWWCWIAAGSMLLIVGVPSLVVLALLNRRRALYPVALWGARAWLKACGTSVKVRGLDLLEPDTEYVFASNHRSYLDTATLFAYTGKRMGLVAKKELLKVPVLGQGMSFVNIIAIDRSNPERALESMDKAREVMNDGYSFGVFAEGTRAMPGELLPFKKGAFHLAVQTQGPIVPVAIKHTDVLMGKNTGLAYSGEIEMVILAPIPTAGKTTDEVMELLLLARAAVAEELSREE
jgi:1-acyl-sn-glycerol-3-phosphate acyltransferase